TIGLKLSQMVGSFVSEADFRLIKNTYESAFVGEAQQFEIEMHHPDGTSAWREVLLNPIYLEDGSFEDVSAIALDITEKKLSQISLAVNEEKFRQIFESFQ